MRVICAHLKPAVVAGFSAGARQSRASREGLR